MKVRQDARGQPLVALALVLGCWVGVRAMFWDAAAFAPCLPSAHLAGAPVAASAGQAWEGEATGPSPAGQVRSRLFMPMTPPPAVGGPPQATFALRAGEPRYPPPAADEPLPGARLPVQTAAANQLLWMAVLRSPLPMMLALPIAAPAAGPFHPVGHEQGGASRWSADGWLLLRRGGDASLATGPAPSTYGASQAGAVLRYRLGPAGGHRPAAYLRTTAALDGSREREAALGLSARPLRGVPVSVAAELRATVQRGGTRARPAAMLVTELPPFALPYGIRGEAYGQAGYVGGRNATAFVDAQLRIDRRVASLGRAEVRAGAGAWGGAQKGASRLDLGPAATMGMGLGASASARLALDWRFRVTGDAAPSSGPALTLSAGF
jgi:hypothetical protein